MATPPPRDADADADADRSDAAIAACADVAPRREGPRAEVTFGADGRTEPVEAPAGAHLLTVTLSDRGRCAQVDTLQTLDGEVLVEPGDFGMTCQRCRQRESVVMGSGAFALPADATRLPASRVSLTLRDCALGSSLRPLPSGVRATLSWVSLDDPPAESTGSMDLAVIATSTSWLARADDAALRRFEDDVSRELAAASLRVRVASRCALPAEVSSSLELQVGDHAPLVALRRLARERCPGFDAAAPRVTLWGVRCLTLRNAALGQRDAPDGYTTHIPGGGALDDVADGVVLSDGCLGIPGGAAAPPHAARVVAHELGHYLGLYHAVETDGRADLLADTDAANLMNAVPTLAVAHGLSPQQVIVARRHPAVRWSTDGGCAASRRR